MDELKKMLPCLLLYVIVFYTLSLLEKDTESFMLTLLKTITFIMSYYYNVVRKGGIFNEYAYNTRY